MTDQVQELQAKTTSKSSGSHWRNSQLSPKIYKFDYQILILLIGIAMVPTATLKLFGILILIIWLIFLKFAERRGLNTRRALKAIRANLAGKTRPAWHSIHDRRSIDHTPFPFWMKKHNSLKVQKIK